MQIRLFSNFVLCFNLKTFIVSQKWSELVESMTKKHEFWIPNVPLMCTYVTFLIDVQSKCSLLYEVPAMFVTLMINLLK